MEAASAIADEARSNFACVAIKTVVKVRVVIGN